MKIGIMSDSHDNIWRLNEALSVLQGTSMVLHCGDLISPFMVKRIINGLPGKEMHMVWGNNDGDKRLVSEIAESSGCFQTHGEIAELEVEGLRIAMNHYPEIALRLAQSEQFDLVCFGHNHTASFEIISATTLLNPGEVMGMNGRSTVAIFDTTTRKVDFIEFWTEKL